MTEPRLIRSAGRPRTAPVVMKVWVAETTRDALKARAVREGVPLKVLLRGLLENGTNEGRKP